MARTNPRIPRGRGWYTVGTVTHHHEKEAAASCRSRTEIPSGSITAAPWPTERCSTKARDETPLAFTVGLGQVIPGFEAAVVGLEPGESVNVTIEPQDAYGPHHAELRHAVTLADFASTPYIGGEVNLVSPEGDEMPGRIVSIEGDDVTIDFNHPLAGETLVFEITLVEFDAGPET